MSRHETAVDRLGTEIIEGRRAVGSVFTTAQVEAELGISRSVAREAVRVLESLGLVSTSPRVGCSVQGPAHWNTLSPQIIRWRMNGPDQTRQLRALTELRAGVEPQAAALAARRASWDDIATLEATAQAMEQLGAQGLGDTDDFLRADLDFHARLLQATGNPAYVALGPTILTCLETRNQAGLTPAKPSPENLRRHTDLAVAIRERDEHAARDLARQLVECVVQEVQ